MAPSDSDSEPSKAPTTIMNPFSIFARSTSSSKSAKHSRNTATPRPVVPPVPSKLSAKPFLDDHTPHITAPTILTGNFDTAAEVEKERRPSEVPAPDVFQTPDPRSNVSQASGTTSKKARAKTSRIHQYISTRGDNFVCNRCSRVYKSSGGTGAIARHLKKAHFIDPTVSGVVEKRTRERPAINASILRGVDLNTKVEDKRRERLTGIGLNKATLEHLYLQWIITMDSPFDAVMNKAFWSFLEYVNPVASRMLQESEPSLRIRAEALLAERKSGV